MGYKSDTQENQTKIFVELQQIDVDVDNERRRSPSNLLPKNLEVSNQTHRVIHRQNPGHRLVIVLILQFVKH